MTNNSNGVKIAGLASIVALVVALIAGIVGVSAAGEEGAFIAPLLTVLVTAVITAIPAVIAAVFSEKASRDLRNGLVTKKVKDALTEAGIIDPVTGQVTTQKDRENNVG